MSKITRHIFENKIALADALAMQVSENLEAAIARKGSAILAVSGGSTPKIFFNTLSTQPIDWKNVTVTLVDERWVDEDDERSNARLVKQNLLINNAAAAKFMGLFVSEMKIELALDQLQNVMRKLPLPIDVAILGMGSDGHTASFFPGGDKLDFATDPNCPQLFSSMQAKGAGEPRVTMTMPLLLEADNLILHIEGEEKQTVLEKASAKGEANALPIRHILRNAPQLNIFWAP